MFIGFMGSESRRGSVKLASLDCVKSTSLDCVKFHVISA